MIISDQEALKTQDMEIKNRKMPILLAFSGLSSFSVLHFLVSRPTVWLVEGSTHCCSRFV